MNLKDVKNQLVKQYPYRIELHAHTSPASRCSEISPREMVETYKALGYSAVVIANHFVRSDKEKTKEEYIDYYLQDFEQTEQCGKELGLKVYLGAEIRFAENRNDYLIYGVDRALLEEVYDFLPFGVEHFRKNYIMPKSLFIQAHPLRDKMERVDPALLDGIEVFNLHPNHNSRVGIAAVYAKENNLSIITAGTDFHHPNRTHEGLTALRAATLPEDSFALAKLIKEKDYVFELGREHIVL